MVVPTAGIASVAYVTNHLSLMHVHSSGQIVSITLKMSVIEDQFLVRTQLVDCCATTLALKQLNDLSIGGGEHRGSRGCWDIDRVVHTTFRPRVIKCIE